MRKPFIAGNWKMNLDRSQSVELATAIGAGSSEFGSVEIGICPPTPYLEAVAQAVSGTSVGVGSQNLYHEASGAFTGEISAAMVSDIGCKYAILGHSERRNILGESNEDVNKKVHATLAGGLIPIVCVGELLEEREAGSTMDVIRQQFAGSLSGVSAEDMAKTVIAYEPVWAIGTGKVATPEQAEEVHRDLRGLLTEHYNADVAAAVRIQYGGSVKPDNAAELLACENIDGALVGGASLKPDSFLAIIAAAAK